MISLTFHGVGPITRRLAAGEDRVWLSRSRFEQVLDMVCERADVRITFDDGNSSDFDIALAALTSRQLRAEFFVLAGRLGEHDFLSQEQLRTLASSGMGIGCHGMHHRPWRGLDKRSLQEELIEARDTLQEALGHPVRWASFPFGSYDWRVLRALREAGYERVFSSDRGRAADTEWLQPRYTIRCDHDNESLRRILSPSTVFSQLGYRVRAVLKRFR